MERFQQEGLVSLHTAYSRIEGQNKTYVQHLMEQNSHEIIALMDQGAKLYVCGDGSKMAPDVEMTLQRAYQKVHDVSEQEALEWMNNLQKEGRYAKDVWAGI
ncbi:Bifunctional NADPH reductase [compost metagenome]